MFLLKWFCYSVDERKVKGVCNDVLSLRVALYHTENMLFLRVLSDGQVIFAEDHAGHIIFFRQTAHSLTLRLAKKDNKNLFTFFFDRNMANVLFVDVEVRFPNERNFYAKSL